ncbi:MAG: methionyl-tRNA formyltransferase [Acidimicrobiales bacterium]
MSRLAFLGTPAAAVPCLRALVAAGHEVDLVVTRRDARRSRRGDPEPSPVKSAALELGLTVTDELDAVCDAAVERGVELGVVVAYGRIIPQRVLDVVPMINVHFSLLPRWRGAAPVERAILAGDEVTGVSVMRLEAGLDTGPVLSRVETAIGAEETAEELMARLSELGAALLVETLSAGASSLGPGHAQEGETTYAQKIEPDELELHFDKQADYLARVVRIGRAWTTFREKRLIVTKAVAITAGSGAAGESVAGESVAAVGAQQPGTIVGSDVVTSAGLLRLVEVQPEGRKRVGADEWVRGARIGSGERLGH